MSEQEWDIDELLGHPTGKISLPSKTEENNNWASEDFLTQVFERIPIFGRRHLTFVDMFFAKPISREFFGAVVACEKALGQYEEVLKFLLNNGFTVGSHPKFQEGDCDSSSPKTKGWLLWLNEDDRTVRQNPPITSQFKGKGFDVNKLFKEDKSFEILQQEVESKSVQECWSEYITQLQGASNIDVNFVAGLPITIHVAGVVSPVAGLFMGGVVENGNDDFAKNAKRVVANVARSLVGYALRAYTLQHAEHAQQYERAVATAQIYEKLSEQIKLLSRQFQSAGSTLQGIEATITTSNEDFLGHYSTLRKLFETKETKFYYGVKEVNVVKKDNGEKIISSLVTEAEKETLSQDGFTNDSRLEVISVHANCNSEQWEKIRAFLREYGEAKRLPLIKAFGYSADKSESGEQSDNGKTGGAADAGVDGKSSSIATDAQNSDGSSANADAKKAPEGDTAMNLHAMVKQMIIAPQVYPKRVYPLQVALAAATAWSTTTEEAKKVLAYIESDTNKKCEFEPIKCIDEEAAKTNVQKLNGFITQLAKFDNHIKTDSDSSPRATIAESASTSTPELLGSIMRFVGVELTKRSVNDDRIKATEVFVEIGGQYFDLIISCDGHFKEPAKLLLDSSSQLHGLRNCIAHLCESVGQQQLMLASGDQKSVKSLFDSTDNLGIVLSNYLDGTDRKSMLYLRYRFVEGTK